MKTKRILAFILSVVMLLGLVIIPGFATWDEDCPDVNLKATKSGSTISVEVSISKAAGLKSFQFELKYPKDKVEVSSTKKEITQTNNAFFTENGDKAEINESFKNSGSVNFAVASSDLLEFSKDTVISKVEFGLLDGAEGDIDFALKEVKVSNGTDEKVTENGATATINLPITAVTLTGDFTPVKGKNPVTSLTSSSDGATATVAWTTADGNPFTGKFAASTEYIATITVSPKTGWSFADGATVKYSDTATASTIGDITLTKDVASGNYVATKSFTTPAKALTALEVTTPPTLEYTSGQSFNAAMTVKATYDDATVDTAYTNYTVSPADGTALKVADNGKPVTLTDNTNSSITANAGTLAVTAKKVTNPTIMLDETSFTYDGSAKKPNVTSVMDGTVAIPASEYTIDYENNVNASTATSPAKVLIVDAAGGEFEVSGTATFTINKADITPAPTVSITGWNYGDYDAATNAPQVSANPGEATVTYTYKTADSGTTVTDITTASPGSYTVTADIPATDNYNGATTAATTFKIERAAMKPTPEVSLEGWTYGDAAKTPTVTGNLSTETPTFTYYDKDDNKLSAQPTNAGDYKVTATIPESTLYGATTTEPATFTIAQKEVTLSWAGTDTRTYDGNASNVTATVSNKVNTTDEVNVTVTNGDKTDADTYTATATGLTGAAAGNYKLPADTSKTTQSYTINPLEATLTWAGADTRTYDGNASNVTATVSNLAKTTDVVNVTVSGGTETNASDTAYTATATGLTGAAAGNYKLPTDTSKTTQSYTINPLEATLSWAGTDTRIYDGNASNVTATVSNLAKTTDVVNVTVTNGDKTDAGTYTATATGLTGAAAANYKLPTDASKDYTINKKTITLDPYTAKNLQTNKEYTNETIAAMTAIAPMGDDAGAVTYTLKTDGSKVKAVTEGTSGTIGATLKVNMASQTAESTDAIVITVTSEKNYEPADVTVNFSIVNKKNVNDLVSIAPKTVTYDGQPQAVEGTYNGTQDNTSTWTFTYVGTQADGTDYNSTIAPTAAGTYNVTGVYQDDIPEGSIPGHIGTVSTPVTLKINPKDVTITGVTAADRAYDGTTTVTLSGGALQGVLTADTDNVGFTLGDGTLTNKNVGTGKAVTTAITLTGSAKDNYSLTQPTVTVSISQKDATITGLAASNKDYDGTTTATVTGTATIPELVGTDDVTVTPGTAAFADANAGTGKTVSFTGYSLTGDDADNYNLTAQPADVTADINQATVTISTDPTASAITYGQQLRKSDLSGGAAVAGTTPVPGAFAWTDGTVKPAVADSDTTAYGVTFTPTDANNYKAATTAITLTVNPAEQPAPTGLGVAAPTAEGGNGTITGTTVAGTDTKQMEYSTEQDFADATLINDCSAPSTSVAPGTYFVRNAASADGNYKASEPVQIVVPPYDTNVGTVGDADDADPATKDMIHPDQSSAVEGAQITFTVDDPGDGTVPTEITVKVGGTTRTLAVRPSNNGTYVSDPVQMPDPDTSTTTNEIEIVGITQTDTPTVTLSPTTLALTVGGAAGKVTVNVSPAPTGEIYTDWSIDDPAVAEITASDDGSATITGLTAGTGVTLTAKVKIGDSTTSTDVTCTVNVTAPSPAPRPSGGGGGGAAPADNPVNVPASSATTHGKVTSSASSAKAGDKVTVTATPDEGYQVADVKVTDAKGNPVAVTKNADGTYSFTMPATAVTIEPVFEEVTTPVDPDSGDVSDKFTDVGKTAWYHDAVQWAVDQGIMNGVGDDKFAPDDTGTRAMVVTMLWRMVGEPEGSDSDFSDVSDGAWYADAVDWAASTGAVKGTSDTTFSPNEPVTREQLAAVLYRYAQAQGKGFTGAWAFPLNFSDAADVSEYAYEAMCWMTMNGVINGMDDGTLAPKANATRAQIAAMFMRFADAMAK